MEDCVSVDGAGGGRVPVEWRLAQWIISVMPPHKSCLEPFFGSGAVFFNKPPSRIETINDLDGEIVNIFTVIRDHAKEKVGKNTRYTYYVEFWKGGWER